MDLFNNKSKSTTTNDKKHLQALAANSASNDNKLYRKSSAQKSPPLSPRERAANPSVKEFYFGSNKPNTPIQPIEKSPRQITSSKSNQPAAMSLSKPQNQSLHVSNQALPKTQIKPQSSHQNIANLPTLSNQAPRYQVTHFSNTSTIQPISKKSETPITQQPSRINSAQIHQNPQHVKTPLSLQQVSQGESQRPHSKILPKVAEPKPSQMQNSASILNLIIKSDNATGKSNTNFEDPIFDPEPAPEETDTFSHTIFLDDRSFMVDDDELDREVSRITSTTGNGKNGDKTLIQVVNEVPEGRISKRSSKSSRASSSIGSNSTYESSNRLADFSDSVNVNDHTANSSYGDSVVESEFSDSTKDGCKNELLDTLIRKFNVNLDESIATNPQSSSRSYARAYSKNSLDDSRAKKYGEIQKKIYKNQVSDNNAEVIKKHQQKLNCRVSKLPQTFLCKYLGKMRAQGLWGVRYTREPVDRLVDAAKRLKSLDDLPTMDVLISEKGIYVVQKVSNHAKSEKHFRSGLIPIANVSYGIQDSKYFKIFSFIVVRERDSKTLCECYAFLCPKNDTAKKMALSLTLAFKEYGKQLQVKESNIRRTILLDDGKEVNKNRDSVA